MSLPNRDRALVALLREIAEERGIQMTTFSQDWIIRLEKDSVTKHVFGYNFELNSATAQMMAGDKSAVSDLLQFKNIPHVEHRLFLRPRLATYVSSEGNWDGMMAYAGQHKFEVVCKPNVGSGGAEVTRIQNQLELEQAVHRLFVTTRSICLTPFFQIENEYRVFVLAGECELVYVKKRPTITGDGRSTLFALIEKQKSAGKISQEVAADAFTNHKDRLDEVLNEGSQFPLNWKHNLAQGAYPEIVEDETLLGKLESLALESAAALNIQFASVDIIETEGRFLALEVNSGVMMESFVQLRPDGRQKAKAIYAKAVDLMFGER